MGSSYRPHRERCTSCTRCANSLIAFFNRYQKLFLNSGYGALSCIYLKVNNLLAANQITASARATSWMVTHRLNAFQTITDGCAFSWLHILLHKTFKEILTENPNYLIDFDPEIKNDFFNYENANQDWIDHNFKEELVKFYGVDVNYPPIAKFDFELKDETFCDRLLVVLILLQGCRQIELYRLNVGDVIRRANQTGIKVCAKGSIRVIPLKEDVADLLDRYLEARKSSGEILKSEQPKAAARCASRAMFISFSPNVVNKLENRLTRNSMQRIVNGYLEAAAR